MLLSGAARVAEAAARAHVRIEQGTAPPPMNELTARLMPREPIAEHEKQIPVQSGRRILVLPTEEVPWFGVADRLRARGR